MSDVECPYCGTDLDINHDEGQGYEEDEEDVLHQQTCRKCDKTFVYTTSVQFYYDVQKADCLNGGDHKFDLTRTYPREMARLRCTECGEEKSVQKSSKICGG